MSYALLIRELVQSTLMPVILDHVSREYVLHELFFFSEEAPALLNYLSPTVYLYHNLHTLVL